MSEEQTKQELLKRFEGMGDRESVSFQTEQWAKGVPLHNPVRDECCPDFSCCGGTLMSFKTRQRFLEARRNGEDQTVSSILSMGLSGLVSELDPSGHVIAEGDGHGTRH